MRRGVWLTAAILLLVLAPSAYAVDRHASPTGVGTGTCTAAEPPCDLRYAVETVGAGGDAVIVAAGDYALSSPLVVNKPIHVHGAAGQPRPRLVSSSPGAVNASGAGLTLSDLQIEGPGSSATAVVFGQTLASGTSVLERLTVLGGPGANGSAVRVGRGWDRQGRLHPNHRPERLRGDRVSVERRQYHPLREPHGDRDRPRRDRDLRGLLDRRHLRTSLH